MPLRRDRRVTLLRVSLRLCLKCNTWGVTPTNTTINVRTIFHAHNATWKYEFELEFEFIVCGGPWDRGGGPLGRVALTT